MKVVVTLQQLLDYAKGDPEYLFDVSCPST